MPTISVIVPVYNVEKYLDRCVESILSQTFTDFELILVDDGSLDRSGAMCDEYAEKDNRITVIHQENQGQAAARNHGVEIAKGEWISFVDSDDAIHPRMLEVLYNGIKDTDATLSMCDVVWKEVFPEWDDVVPCVTYRQCESDNEQTLISLVDTGGYRYWIPCAKLIHKSLVQKHPFAKSRIFEDNAIVFKWIHDAQNVVDCDEKLYWYRYNPHGTLKSAFSVKKLDYLWALSEQIAFYISQDYQQMRQKMCNEYFRMVIGYYDIATKQTEYAKIVRILRRNAKKIYSQNRSAVTLTEYEHGRLRAILYPKTHRLRDRLGY